MAKTTFDDIKRALWAGANTFRDNIDASNYKDYVLSMFFVKYLSDTFDENVKELEKDYSGIRLERQIANLPFSLKKEYTFDYLLENAQVVGTPGAGFGENGKNYFRLTSFGKHEKTKEAMERFNSLF